MCSWKQLFCKVASRNNKLVSYNFTKNGVLRRYFQRFMDTFFKEELLIAVSESCCNENIRNGKAFFHFVGKLLNLGNFELALGQIKIDVFVLSRNFIKKNYYGRKLFC